MRYIYELKIRKQEEERWITIRYSENLNYITEVAQKHQDFGNEVVIIKLQGMIL